MRALPALAALLALVLPVARAVAQGGETVERAAAAELVEAEEMASHAQYAAAAALYKRIAERWPQTAVGKVAARRAQANAFLGWSWLVHNGPSENRIDVVVMGDGYTLEKQSAFDDVARSVPKNFAHEKVLSEYLSYHNFIRANVVSAQDGIDGFGRQYDTALGGRVTNMTHGQAGVERARVRAMLGELPAHDDLAIVFVKKGTLGTGGSGVAVVGGRDDDTVIHEWGHAFVGLADEYVDQVFRGEVRDGINVAGTGDPKLVPWRHWIAAGVPGIGVHEGAAGMQRGAWKPTASGCTMEHGRLFCRVCREALVLAIYRLVDPIDGCTPPAHALDEKDKALRDKLRFEVQPMRPKTHALEVRWWVLPESEVPAPPRGPERSGRGHLRDGRGPLSPISSPPVNQEEAGSTNVLVVDRRKLAPGRYRVVCRVRDTTRLPSDAAWPLVLKDDRGLLESERAWWIEVSKG